MWLCGDRRPGKRRPALTFPLLEPLSKGVKQMDGESMTAQVLQFNLTGLSCASCVGRAQKAVTAVSGVQTAQVDLASETVRLTVRDGAESGVVAAQAQEALLAAGYPAQVNEVRLQIGEMSCASCVLRSENAMMAGAGVLSAAVNFADETATVRFLEGAITPAQIAALSTKAGYPAQVQSAAPSVAARKADEMEQLRRKTLIAAVLALPVFVLEMGAHLVPAFHHWQMATIGSFNSHLLQFVLTTLLLAGPGRVFYVKGFPTLFKGAPEMNALVALGTSAAYLFSVVSTFAPGLLPDGTANVYYEAAAVIVVLILMGRWMEARAKGRTGAAIAALIDLQPPVALVERKGEVKELPIEMVAVGDVLHLRPGAKVAVDGRVLDGQSYVDESMVSGEPVPVLKAAGDVVIGGTINGQGSLRFEAEKVGADTMLAQIVEMVRTAQGAKLPIQGLVDRITAVFVPVVIGIALLTCCIWAFWGPEPALGHALVAGVAVLIIACPCAMGLATPTSIMVGTGRAAQLGVLFRKGGALQSLQAAKVVAFDKTGTLTEGAPSVTDVLIADGFDEALVLAQVAAVESASEHPLARALVGYARARDVSGRKSTGFEAVVGMGATAMVDGQRVAIGNLALMAAETVDVSALQARAEALAAQGKTPMFVAVAGQLAAVVAVADAIKSEAKAAIATLHEMGLKVAMISGDTQCSAEVVGAQLGVDHVVAGVLPEGKVAALAALRQAHGAVVFVGDGINDAPALAAADVGLAIGTGTDVAIEAADVVLMSGDVTGVLRALEMSRKVIGNIHQNLFWAFGYNVALIPVAAGILVPFGGPQLSPMLGAGAMALSSVFVLSNALRLRRAGGDFNQEVVG